MNMDEDQSLDVGLEAAEAAETAESADLVLDESGELNVPDSFWGDEFAPKDDAEPAEPTGAAEPAPEGPPAVQQYTAEEIGQAFIEGRIDESRLPQELIPYYQAIAAQQQRAYEAEMVQRQIQAVQYAQQQQVPQATWDDFTNAANQLAARKFLGIKPDQFDEFNPQHMAAQQMAMLEIREYAMAAQQQQMEDQRFQDAFTQLYVDYKQKEPDMDVIAHQYFNTWKQGLTVRENAAVDAAMQSRDLGQMKGVLDKLISDYRKSRGGQSRQKQAVAAPPAVVGAGNAGEAVSLPPDFSKLGDMTPDEQAAWLIANKYVA